MASVQIKLGPKDHDRPLTLDDFDEAEFEPGFRYEIIDGRLYVSNEPNFAENYLENWLFIKLITYSLQRQDIINYVTVKSRLFVHSRRKPTVPEPDIAAYRDLPRNKPFKDIHWRELGPVLVAEVLVEGDPYKDLERNRELYLEAPTIREYWILDGRENPEEPTLIQHRRRGKRWIVKSFPYSSTFTTKLLPGFSVVIDPRK
ncbi:MAG TPA: Uma2 family endonuclease [Gemmata sp.]|jgi:Uma2 family endonuclease|nr:Uma2 family endonuclease [Gemmata sp.]